ncbi:GDNF family receptor alpha-2a [Trichomycterus rosablanca]|uniref:GDNF family receptor alpha-2a n=1 Tax=Trichomycterus rosablanca TaxID=2290929 RepID=UPI002F3519A5
MHQALKRFQALLKYQAPLRFQALLRLAATRRHERPESEYSDGGVFVFFTPGHLGSCRKGVIMYLLLYGFLLLMVDLSASSSSSHASTSLTPQDFVDCVRASEDCNLSPQCSPQFRIIKQCLVGKDWSSMLGVKECQAALEVLQETPLMECRCKRGMKKELQCLQHYWSIHMSLNDGEDFYEASPYEPMPPVQLSEAVRLASIISSIHTGTGKGQPHCSDPSRPCNPCLDATKACNLNDNCKRQRSNYINTCTSKGCNRKRCHKALRQFLERVDPQYSFGLLFCSCREQACAERRRQTIVPSCAYEDKTKPNCLHLRGTCRNDPLCRSRLADFHTHCLMGHDTISTCPDDNYQACLTAYTGLIGTDLTPNYEDSNHTDFTISPWCSCKNSGNQEGECEEFLRDFKENTCLRNAIQAFGYGTDFRLAHKSDAPLSTPSVNPHSGAQNNPTANPVIITQTYEPEQEASMNRNMNRIDGLRIHAKVLILSLIFALVGNLAA